MKQPYVVLDIETTGLSKNRHKITEIAALRIENFQVVKKFQTLINPQTHIPSFITSLTGISDAMVKDAPLIEEIIPKFLRFMKNDPFVAHCATFDHGFLNYNSIIYTDKEITNPKICTRKLSRRLIPELGSYKLSRVCEHFEIRNSSAHRAMGDVEATHKIFNNLLGIMRKQGIEKQEQVLSFQDGRLRN